MFNINNYIGFRVTTSIKHGRGHLNRCLQIAKSLDHKVVFFIDPKSHNINSKIYSVREVSNNSANLAIDALKEKKINILVFDNYNIDFEEIEKANIFGRCVVIDDYMKPWKNTVVISPNLGVSNRDYIGNKHVFAGPKYILIDKSYKEAFGFIQRSIQKKYIKNSILIQMGAIDSKNYIKKILKIITEIKDKIKIITVVISKNAPHMKEIKNILENFDNAQITEVNNTSDMIKLHMDHNLIIGASGVSLLERLSMGIYSLTFALNKNQELNSDFFKKNNLGVYGGRIDKLDLKFIQKTVINFIIDNKTQFLDKNISHTLIDGKGSDRVAKILKKL